MGINGVGSFYVQNYDVQDRGRSTRGKISVDDFACIGNATSLSESSDNGKRIGITTVGNRGYIAMYADSSTEQDPIVKVGDYEVRVKDVNPNNATKMEMFALMSYMDDKGLTNNQGMKSFNKMTAYSSQAEYNGYCSGISDENAAWTVERDWIGILGNAKETFFSNPQTYNQGLECERIIENLKKWSGASFDDENTDYQKILSERKSEIYEKLKNGDTEVSFQIGGSSFTEKEWDKLLSEVDDITEEMREAMREEHQKRFAKNLEEKSVNRTESVDSTDAIPVDAELENGLAEAIGVDDIEEVSLEGYYIGIHARTGIQYVMRSGDEGRGGKVLLRNASDVAKYNALADEYYNRYPNLVTSQELGRIYASFEICGMMERTETGFVRIGFDNISYNDNFDYKKNWSAKLTGDTWELLWKWLEENRSRMEKIGEFSTWGNIIDEIGGSYERIWSDWRL